jgi:uncharacterized membrane protein YqjE
MTDGYSTSTRLTPTSAATAATSPEPSTTDLVATAADQVRTLVQDELALARAELKAKAKRAAFGGGLMGAAALLGRDSLLVAWTLVIVLLDLVWPLWAAVLVTLAGLVTMAAACGGLGWLSLRKATPPAPTTAAESVATDVRAVREAAQEGRSRS